jgi:hypothetical protein
MGARLTLIDSTIWVLFMSTDPRGLSQCVLNIFKGHFWMSRGDVLNPSLIRQSHGQAVNSSICQGGHGWPQPSTLHSKCVNDSLHDKSITTVKHERNFCKEFLHRHDRIDVCLNSPFPQAVARRLHHLEDRGLYVSSLIYALLRLEAGVAERAPGGQPA